MASDPQGQQLLAAVQLYQQAPAQAIEQLRPLATGGDSRAIALISYFLLQQGDIDAGLPFAEQASQRGYGQIAQMYAADLAQRAREELRARAPEFAGVALDNGYSVDIFGLITSSAQQGSPDVVAELLESAEGPRPLAPRQQWDELIAKATAEGEQIGGAAAEVAGQRDRAFAAIQEDTDAVSARRTDAERQADELGLVTSAIAAENLANAYAEDAQRTEGQARNFTWASLVIGAISVAVSAYGLISVKAGSSFDTVIARAAFGLPVALLAAYVNNLATTHRREAWRLRHIELQIRTANPFLGLLDSERRRETLAALALRFFPGQENMGSGSTDQESPLDLIQALGTLLREQQAKTVVTPAAVSPVPLLPES